MKTRSTPASLAPVTVKWAVDREFSHDVSLIRHLGVRFIILEHQHGGLEVKSFVAF